MINDLLKEAIDISWPLKCDNTTSWRNNNPIHCVSKHSFENKEHEVRESYIENFNMHSGTHIDAPSHFLLNGHSIEGYDIRQLSGHALVLDLTSEDINGNIERKHVIKFNSVINKGDIILLYTTNSYISSNDSFNSSFVGLSVDAAQFFIEKEIKAIGIDYLGIERSDLSSNHETHKILFENHIVIIEGLRLLNIPSLKATTTTNLSQTNNTMIGEYFFLCLPIHIIGLEASPCRALLLPFISQS